MHNISYKMWVSDDVRVESLRSNRSCSAVLASSRRREGHAGDEDLRY